MHFWEPVHTSPLVLPNLVLVADQGKKKMVVDTIVVDPVMGGFAVNFVPDGWFELGSTFATIG